MPPGSAGRTRALRAAIVAVAASMALALWPSQASAYVILFRPYEESTVTYHNSLPEYREPLKIAIRQIHGAKVGVRIKATSSKSRAMIRVRSYRKGCGDDRNPGVTEVSYGHADVFLARRCRGIAGIILAAHELGHALGLGHEDRRCATLNSTADIDRGGIPSHCSSHYDWRHKPYRSDDIRGLKRIYR